MTPSDLLLRKVNRRRVVGGLGASALLLGVFQRIAPAIADKTVIAPTVAGAQYSPLAFISIQVDGTVVLVSHRVEMGQGIRSTLTAVLADELGADLTRVRVVQANADETRYGNQNTDGSRSMRDFLIPMRQMGAAVRTMLSLAAAKQWQVPADEVVPGIHELTHPISGRSLSFADLATAAARLPVPTPDSLRLKSFDELRYVGRRIPNVDIEQVVDGTARYAGDHMTDDACVAVMARPPDYGATVDRVDARRARQIPGVIAIVHVPPAPLPSGFQPLGGVAVVARDTWSALKGRDALRVDWKPGPNAHYDSIEYERKLAAASLESGHVVRQRGDALATLRDSPRRISADYYMPHLAHAPMEPPVAVARFEHGRISIVAATQDPQGARNEVARALELPVAQVEVRIPLLGGGFGRKSKPDFVVEAAYVARALPGRTVKLQWTREDDLRHGYYHTVCAAHLEAAIDSSGRITAWLHRSVFPSIMTLFEKDLRRGVPQELSMGFVDLPFDVPNIQLENNDAEAHARIGWFRSVANLQHVLPIACFVDEVARFAGRDPLELLRELIGPPRKFDPRPESGFYVNYRDSLEEHPIDTGRLRRVLDVVAEAAKWTSGRLPGEGCGVAVHRSFGSYVAVVVRARVDADGALEIPRVDIGIDCGPAVNPDRIRAQLEGSVIMGITQALHGEIHFDAGRVRESNFHDYPLLRINEAPHEIHTHVIEPVGDVAAGGVGEPGMPAVAPALLNAIHSASGHRIRRLPVGDRALARPR